MLPVFLVLFPSPAKIGESREVGGWGRGVKGGERGVRKGHEKAEDVVG